MYTIPYHEPNERLLISFDYALKCLLRDKANYEVPEGFLSELLRRNITVKSIGESESKTNERGVIDRYNGVDVLAEDENGDVLLIELQFLIEMDFFNRVLYGTGKGLIERMERGSKYPEVKKFYLINIVFFDLGKGEDYVYHGRTTFKGLHLHDKLHLYKGQRDVFGKEMPGDISPERYIIKVTKFDGVVKDTLDEWIYFLKRNIVLDDFTAKGLDKAREIMDYEKLTLKEYRAYEWVLDERSHDLSRIASAKHEGKAIGLEKGLKKTAEQVALNALKEGISIELIQKITCLTEDEIRALQETN
jgi:predicted transposase/invertase (TIGR01784 family)